MTNMTNVMNRLVGVIFSLVVFTMALAIPLSAHAGDAVTSDKFTKAVIDDGKIIFNARFRYEYVEQDNALFNAHAVNLRARLGYETGYFYGLGFGFDVENVHILGPDRYNSTVNGHSDYSTVVDPEDTELNQLFFKFGGKEAFIPDTTVKVGRQRIIWDNHRFIGNVGWRQNEQTFDSARIINTSIPNTSLQYIYIDKVHRIFTKASATVGTHDMSSHLARVGYKFDGVGELSARAVLLDYDRASTSGNSSKTFGVRFAGKHPLNEDWKVLYTGEYANQENWKQNTADFDLDYWFGEGGIDYKGITLKVGYESLEGNGTSGFQTPLATLHLFEGWTDLFLTTPADGITDLYAKIGTKIYGTSLLVGIKTLEAENTSADYGTETFFDIKRTFWGHVTPRLTGAFYDSDDDTVAVDTTKIWVGLTYKY